LRRLAARRNEFGKTQPRDRSILHRTQSAAQTSQRTERLAHHGCTDTGAAPWTARQVLAN
jgi:hypothetical protein